MLPSVIPDEIWRYIFLILDGLEDQADSPLTREEMIGSLSSVCRTWRDVCTSTSALWKHVTFDDRQSNVHAELLRIGVSLARSNLQQLDVSIAIGSSDPSILSLVVLSLADHLERVRKLDLGLVFLDPPHSPRLDVSTWPIMFALEDLTLENIRFNSSTEFHMLLRCTPALRTLRVGGLSWIAHLLPDIKRETMILPLLREFTLDSYVLYTFVDAPCAMPALERVTLLNTEYGLSWNTLLSRLEWEARPTELTLSGAFPEASISAVLSFFPTIESLVLYSCPADVVHLLRDLPSSRIPALQHLTIDRGQLSNLQALSFLDGPITGAALAPNIKLHVRDCPYVSRVVGAKLVQRGRATFEDANITQGELLAWVANDYAPFGLRFYPSKRRHRKPALTGHF
ncbi:hypothetical protein CALVIDRAFT_537399 [Calocera viscosa TUFC12733]|uniref:F-box domain-containing protein n=1 Tax=Calocera viscosa (strain TUFC12733) TaxID=1330018 RepID=A0A167M062_CALVF|nr:hypothetical protein CALVIDRAFT_537399 [Calocera viscosa TUFC12733]